MNRSQLSTHCLVELERLAKSRTMSERVIKEKHEREVKSFHLMLQRKLRNAGKWVFCALFNGVENSEAKRGFVIIAWMVNCIRSPDVSKSQTWSAFNEFFLFSQPHTLRDMNKLTTKIIRGVWVLREFQPRQRLQKSAFLSFPSCRWVRKSLQQETAAR